MIFLAKVGLVAVGTAVAAGGIISSEGFVHVQVHQKGPEGHDINIVAPATLMTAGLHFVPRRHLCQASAQMEEWGPVARTAIEQLEEAKDFTLVEVVEKGQHVRVSKTHGAIVVDVDDPNEKVYVSTPLRAIDSTLSQLEANATAEASPTGSKEPD
jgi:hypothetical protein